MNLKEELSFDMDFRKTKAIVTDRLVVLENVGNIVMATSGAVTVSAGKGKGKEFTTVEGKASLSKKYATGGCSLKEKYKELSFFSHNVLVKIEGFRIERLLNKTSAAGVKLADVRFISEGEVYCQIAAKDLKTLKKAAHFTYQITVINEKGPAYQTKHFLKSPAKVVGLILACMLVISQSLFVKEIEVNGYKGVPEEALRKCLEEEGITEGTFKPEVDWDKAEKRIFSVFPEITWVQLVYDGRLVILNVSETDRPIYEKSMFGEKKENTYDDIVAVKSGYVEKINAYYGEAKAERGDWVEEGQVLIAGRVPIEPTTFEESDAKEYFVNAEGEVTAKVPYRVTFNQERYVREPLGDGSFIENKREKTRKEEEARVEQQIRFWAKENLPENAQILNKSLNFFPKENIIEIGVTIEVRQEIGMKQEALIGEAISDTG